jgi:hypothetical protein
MHTVSSLQKIHRRQNQRALTEEKILAAMRGGACLHRCNRRQRVIWALSTGEFVTPEAAADVLCAPHVVGVGDSLLGPELSQTFRYAE